MRVYLAGQMSGLPLHNFPAFHEAAARLRELGHEVVNPAELDDPDHEALAAIPREVFLRRDGPLLMGCDAIALLPGWWRSIGARWELAVALGIGMTVLDPETGEPA